MKNSKGVPKWGTPKFLSYCSKNKDITKIKVPDFNGKNRFPIGLLVVEIVQLPIRSKGKWFCREKSRIYAVLESKLNRR
jgi:hypothetical protein